MKYNGYRWYEIMNITHNIAMFNINGSLSYSEVSNNAWPSLFPSHHYHFSWQKWKLSVTIYVLTKIINFKIHIYVRLLQLYQIRKKRKISPRGNCHTIKSSSLLTNFLYGCHKIGQSKANNSTELVWKMCKYGSFSYPYRKRNTHMKLG